MPFEGHDYDQRHYKTPRTISGFYVDRRHAGDRLVGRVAIVILAGLAVAIWRGWL